MIKNLIRKIMPCMVLIIFQCSDVYCQADSVKLDLLTLKDLLNVKVTTASKTSQDVGLAPATVMVITEDQIKIRGYQSLLDVLYDLPDMKIDDKIYSDMRNNFTFRGTPGQEKFVILIDGIRISSPTNEPMPIMENYPVNLAKQIEIVYGPASALYGADAVSGIINIITKTAASKKDLSIDASSAAGIYGYTNSSIFIAKNLGDHSNLVVSGQYYYDQGADYTRLYKSDTLFDLKPNSTGVFNTIYGPMTPQAPVSPKIESPLKAYNLYAALHVDNFSFAIFSNYSQTPSAYQHNSNNAVYNKDVFIGKHINMANASYKKSFENISSTTLLAVSEYSLNPKSNYRNLYSGMERAYKYGFGSMIKLEEQVEWKASKKLNLTGGVGYESYHSMPKGPDLAEEVNVNDDIHGSYVGTKSYYSPNGLPAVFYTLKYNNIGSYIQAQYSPEKKVNITLGARYDRNSRYGSTFNPRAGLVYKPSAKTTIKALFGTAFLAPSPNDSYGFWGDFVTADSGKTFHSYFMHLPNPGLKPVTSKNAEASIQHYFTDNFSITLDGYYTILSNVVVFADDNQSTHLYHNNFNGSHVDDVEVYINQGVQKNYGGSIQLNWKHSIGRIYFNSYAGLSYVNGREEGEITNVQTTPADAQLEFISPLMLHVRTDVKAGKFTCSPRLIIMGKQNLTKIADITTNLNHRQTISGYALLNISLRYSITNQFSIFTNITNALNQHYRSVGYDMDLNKKNTEYFYGQHEDPVRIMGGFNFTF